jgi:hypothetical protein
MTLLERAEAADGVIEDLTRSGLQIEIAHDLLTGYTKAIEGYYREEWGARKVMIAAGALPGSLNRYRDAKKKEILQGVNGQKTASSGSEKRGQ